MIELMDLMTLQPAQSDRQAAQQARMQAYSNEAARQRAYDNTLCLHTIQTWLVEDFDLPVAPTAWIAPHQRPAFWEVVNGSILTVGDTRIAIIPTVVPDHLTLLKELRVQQEWVDIPDWAAHYYLMVELNPDRTQIRVLGYTTQWELRQPVHYDESDRTYHLDSEQLGDPYVMWAAREQAPDWQPTVTPPRPLSPDEAETLIQQLTGASPYSPRLDVAFAQWSALIADPLWQQQLYQRRVYPLVRLSQWLKQQFTAAWQAAEDLVDASVLVPVASLPKDDTANIVRQALPIGLGDRTVILVITRIPLAENEVRVVAQLQPPKGESVLPANAQMSILDATRTSRRTVQATTNEDVIKFDITIARGERFYLALKLDDYWQQLEFAG